MNRLCASLMLACALVPASPAKNRHCVLRIHAEANPADTEVFSTAVRAKLSGKEVAIEKVARIDERDVVSFSAYAAGNNQFGVLLQLDEHGRIALDELSVERRGGFLFVFVNGRAITELQIDKRVSDGQLYIPSGLTAADIVSMKRDWKLIGPKGRR
jgi:hypothetical protein